MEFTNDAAGAISGSNVVKYKYEVGYLSFISVTNAG
jgi:hypothetical protein